MALNIVALASLATNVLGIKLMSEEPLYDVHPLDRDYSDTDLPKAKSRPIVSKEVGYDVRIRKFGIFLGAGGLIVVLLTAIALSNTRGASAAESIASGLNQLGKLTMLAGGLAIVVAYRVEAYNDTKKDHVSTSPSADTESTGSPTSESAEGTDVVRRTQPHPAERCARRPVRQAAPVLDIPGLVAINVVALMSGFVAMMFASATFGIYLLMLAGAIGGAVVAVADARWLRAYGAALLGGALVAVVATPLLRRMFRGPDSQALALAYLIALVNACLCAGFVLRISKLDHRPQPHDKNQLGN